MVGNSSDSICAETVTKFLFDDVYASIFPPEHVLANISEGEICFDTFAMEFRIFSLLTSLRVHLNLIIRHLIHFDEVLWHFMSFHLKTHGDKSLSRFRMVASAEI